MYGRGGSRTAATSKMECFVIIVNGWKPLMRIITMNSAKIRTNNTFYRDTFWRFILGI